MRLLEILMFIAFLISIAIMKKTGHSNKEILSLMNTGKNKSLIMIFIFLLLGMLTAVWMASGTIPYLVKTGIEILRPEIFIVCVFLLCAAMSFLTGSSFGTANILGIVFVTIAKSSGVDLSLTVGAILSGVFVGDRCSPMSSALLLMSTVTESEHYANVKMACKTSLLSVIFSAIIFFLISGKYPMQPASVSLVADIETVFSTNIIVLLPVILLLILCLSKLPVKRAIMCSLVSGILVIMLTKPMDIVSLLKLLIFGFQADSGTSVDALIKGGGMVSMLDVSVIVVFACFLAEFIDCFWKLRPVKKTEGEQVEKSPVFRFLHTCFTSLILSIVGFTQVMPIILTSTIEKDNYKNSEQAEFLKDLSIAGILIPSAVPWNISVLGVTAILGVSGFGYVPYLFFIYLMLLIALLEKFRMKIN